MNELSFFDSFFNDVFGNANSNVAFKSFGNAPRVDVKETKDAYTLEMELPGRSESDVNIELDRDVLSISSKTENKTSNETDNNDVKFILRERKCQSFTRRFGLPVDVQKDSISANFKNGILTINMQKKAIDEPKKIMISAS